MKLRLSVLAKDRKFSKSMRYVYSELQPLREAFESLDIENLHYDSILVGVTDDKPSDFYQEMKNSDRYFQVISGVQYNGIDGDLLESVFNILWKVSVNCAALNDEEDRVNSFFERMRGTVIK